MATETRSRFSKSVVPGLFALMAASYKEFPETWRSIVATKRSKRAYEESAYYSGYGAVPAIGEGEPITYDTRIQGDTKRWTHSEFAMGGRITQVAIEDDLYGVFNSVAKELGKAARETRHVRVADIFNSGFGTTSHTTGGGLAVFTTNHVKLGGGTWANEPSAATALGYGTLQDAIEAFENQTDDRGKKINQTPMTLLVPPELEWKAIELLKSIGTPESAENAPNAVRLARPRLRMVVWPYLTSATAWFLIGDNARNDTGLIHFERIGVTFGREGDFDTGDAKFKVRWRDSVEVNVPIGLYGNPGV